MKLPGLRLSGWHPWLRAVGRRRVVAALLFCLLGSTWLMGALSHDHPLNTTDSGCWVEQLQAHVGPSPIPAPLALAPVAPCVATVPPAPTPLRGDDLPCSYHSRAPPSSIV